MSAGPVVGGWIFDSFGGYSWLFFASLGLAVGAMAIAFAFPRAQEPQLQPA
jgi:MFS family permease